MLGPGQGWAGYLFVNDGLSSRAPGSRPAAALSGEFGGVQTHSALALHCLNRQESNNGDEQLRSQLVKRAPTSTLTSMQSKQDLSQGPV
jgi:hypothetical protein